MKFSFSEPAEDFVSAVHIFLRRRVEIEKKDVGIVVGIVDEHGSSIVRCGVMDKGGTRQVDGDTVFEIGSLTKTFGALLLQEMSERGEVALNDPVAKYLPEIKIPTRNGKKITLLHVATHTSGLPPVPDNWEPERADNPYAGYTLERLNDLLTDYRLPSDPGTKWVYSLLGMGLLSCALARRAGTDYESLVVDRICRPLRMDSTRITLTPELKQRFAQGYSKLGYATASLDFGVLMGGAALRSTVNDHLKYVSANLGLTSSCLTPHMEMTHKPRAHAVTGTDIGLGWFITRDLEGAKIIWHSGRTGGIQSVYWFQQNAASGSGGHV